MPAIGRLWPRDDDDNDGDDDEDDYDLAIINIFRCFRQTRLYEQTQNYNHLTIIMKIGYFEKEYREEKNNWNGEATQQLNRYLRFIL